MSELKSCPFCGGDAKLIAHADSDDFVGVFCQTDGCNAHAGEDWFMERDVAIAAWNRRAEQMDAIREAYASGYSKGHNDTVESAYSPEQSLEEYLAERHQ